jgi:hypothetical protein
VKKRLFLTAVVMLLVANWSLMASASIQWASTVLGYSSTYEHGWEPLYALGVPDAADYGDIPYQAWSPLPNGSDPEFLSLGYTTAVYATGVSIVESYCNGFVYQIDLVDTSNVLHTIWTGTDTTPQDMVAEFDVSFPATAYLVEGVKIYTQIDGWEEIDAVKLTGTPAVPEPTTLIIWSLLGTLGVTIGWWRRRKAV